MEDGNAGMLLNYCFYLLYSLGGEGLYNMLFLLVVAYVGYNVLTSTIKLVYLTIVVSWFSITVFGKGTN